MTAWQWLVGIAEAVLAYWGTTWLLESLRARGGYRNSVSTESSGPPRRIVPDSIMGKRPRGKRWERVVDWVENLLGITNPGYLDNQKQEGAL